MADSTPTGDDYSNLDQEGDMAVSLEERVAQLTAQLAVTEEQLNETRAQLVDDQSGGNELEALKEAKKEILRLNQKLKGLDANRDGKADDNKYALELEEKLAAKDKEIEQLKASMFDSSDVFNTHTNKWFQTLFCIDNLEH